MIAVTTNAEYISTQNGIVKTAIPQNSICTFENICVLTQRKSDSHPVNSFPTMLAIPKTRWKKVHFLYAWHSQGHQK